MSEVTEENKEVKNELPPTSLQQEEKATDLINTVNKEEPTKTEVTTEPKNERDEEINKNEKITENQNNQELLKDIISPEKLELEKKEEEQQQNNKENKEEQPSSEEKKVVLNDIISTTTTTQVVVDNNNKNQEQTIINEEKKDGFCFYRSAHC